MANEHQEPINSMGVKIVTAVGVTATVHSWSDIAAMMGCIYTALLIFEWFWKRVFKPFAVTRGWILGHNKEFMDTSRMADLGDK